MSETTLQQSTATPTPTAKKSSSNWTMIILWVVVISIIALSGWGLMKSNETRPEAGQPAPNLENMQFFNGYEWDSLTVADLEDMQGKVVVLNFWASWCVECRLEAEELEDSWQAYKDDGVVFLGIAHVDVEPKSIGYLEEFGITYPNAPDLGGEAAEKYEITGVPETFIIDQNGQIQYVQIGPIRQTQLNSIIDSLLAQGG